MKVRFTGCLLGLSVLLFVILLPVFLKARQIGQASTSHGNLLRLGRAALTYAREHEDRLPPMGTPGEFKKALFPKYVQDPDTFISRYSKEPYRTVALYSGKKLSAIKNPERAFFIYDVPRSQEDDRRLCVFLNGVVRTVPAAQWRKGVAGTP